MSIWQDEDSIVLSSIDGSTNSFLLTGIHLLHRKTPAMDEAVNNLLSLELA